MNALHRDLKRLVSRVEQADGPAVAADPARQRFHLMPPVGWMNDPNGLCRFGEDYHVFYQYGPFDPNGGVKHWGHYRSRDLIHWEQLPVMLYPDQTFDLHGVYSGSAYIEDGTMYLYYTGNVKHPGDYDYVVTGRGHNTCLAVSRDGVTVESKQCLMENRDYPENLTCHVRDPKVWKQDGVYYMVQGARTKDDVGEVLIFASDDKLHWRVINVITTPVPFGYMWECPDLFELDGQWFLAVSPQGLAQDGLKYQNVYACGYFPLYGDFRGDCTLGEFQEFDHGFDFYAPQSFEDGARRIQLGWMGMPDADYGNPTAAHGWQHCMTVPCILTARDGKLLRYPVPELETLRGAGETFTAAPGLEKRAQTFDLCWQAPGAFSLTIRDSLKLSWADGVLTMMLEEGGAGRTVRRAAVETVDALRVLADRSSVEVFANGGETVLSTRFYPADGCDTLRFHQGTGAAVLYPMCEK